ncbi:ethylene-responsive transcription factor TINY [Tripterygium wilfordii]|uniref:Ethylene-responsive transcription factor TINY n=2 Tax=Tripterygium wilfordii TaxID=458696 RepID=A0A7J7CYJ6_TRIWF|nr:ethylene-responsive transcription factor TINY [Tripterygium wilfordii]
MPRDIQTAAAEAAAMINFDSLSSSSESSPLISDGVSAEAESEELSEIVKLPNIEESIIESWGSDFSLVDSLDGWVYEYPWLDFYRAFPDHIYETETLILGSLFGD